MTGTSEPLAPDLELVDGGGAEGVAGGEQDRCGRSVLVVVGELGDRGRLADAVDADDQDHEGDAALEDLDLAVARGELEQLDHLLAQDLAGEARVDDALLVDPAAQLGDEFLADVPADVGLDQEHFQVLVEVLVDRGAVEEAGDLGEDAAAGLFQPLLELDVGLGLATEELQNHGEFLSRRGGNGWVGDGRRRVAMLPKHRSAPRNRRRISITSAVCGPLPQMARVPSLPELPSPPAPLS